MAKKKKAIEEQKAPLRGGGDPSPNCNSYIVHDPDHELSMKVTGGIVDSVWLDGTEISGGGGEGVSTYSVAITNTSAVTVTLALPTYDNEYGEFGSYLEIDPSVDTTFKVPTSDGSSSYGKIIGTPTATITPSGGVEIYSGMIMVSADGSIAIS